jgi:hypothetical protein
VERGSYRGSDTSTLHHAIASTRTMVRPLLPLVDLPCTAFLSSYPHPAFVLSCAARTTNGGPSLTPLFANPSLRSLLLGPDAGVAELDTSLQHALTTLDQARAFTDWAFPAVRPDAPVTRTIVLDLRLSWQPPDHPRVQLELTQTRLDDVLICTSTPRSDIARFLARPTASTLTRHAASDGAVPRVRRSPRARLHLPDLPHPMILAGEPLSGSSRWLSGSGIQASQSSSASPAESAVAAGDRDTVGCVELCKSFDWESTPLGPMSTWSDVLHSSVSYMLSNPFPVRHSAVRLEK